MENPDTAAAKFVIHGVPDEKNPLLPAWVIEDEQGTPRYYFREGGNTFKMYELIVKGEDVERELLFCIRGGKFCLGAAPKKGKSLEVEVQCQ
jgi:hypothetical protein